MPHAPRSQIERTRVELTSLLNRRSSPGPLKTGEIYLGNFLLERLAQLGVKPMFGVPGECRRGG